MKKFVVLLGLVTVLFASCAQSKILTVTVNDVPSEVTFKPVGWATLDEKNPDVKYNVSVGNVVWSVLLAETIVAPVVLTGWYLFEPDYVKTDKARIVGAE